MLEFRRSITTSIALYKSTKDGIVPSSMSLLTEVEAIGNAEMGLKVVLADTAFANSLAIMSD